MSLDLSSEKSSSFSTLSLFHLNAMFRAENDMRCGGRDVKTESDFEIGQNVQIFP